MTTDTKLRTINTTSKAAPRYRREMWVLNNGDNQRLEAVQINFLRPLPGFTKLDDQGNVKMLKHCKSKVYWKTYAIISKIEKTRRKNAN
jgi:hypothetical protein